MAESEPRTSRVPKPPPGVPVYVPGQKTGEIWAHFASGVSVKAYRNRARSYPGLRSEAPPTQAFYAALTKLGAGTHVIDVGAGSGSGAQLLSESFDQVTAIESDAHAVAFAREVAPLARWVQTDAGRPYSAAPADFAIVADVLGHVTHPQTVLACLRPSLRETATVLVAEPAAYVNQRLRFPVRRAFSPRALRSVLTCAGYQVTSTLCETGTFSACLARPLSDTATDALVHGTELVRRGDSAGALEAFARAALSADTGVRAEAELARGLLHLERGQGDAAARALFLARELEPGDARPLAALSRIALLTGSAPDALKLALEAARLDPTEFDAACAVAIAAETLQHPDAFAAWRMAHALSPDDANVATELARSAAARSDYAFGITALERLRQYRERLDPALHLTLAWLLLAEGRTRDAALEARLVSALTPNDPAVAELWAAIDQTGTAVGNT